MLLKRGKIITLGAIRKGERGCVGQLTRNKDQRIGITDVYFCKFRFLSQREKSINGINLCTFKE